MTKKQKKRPTGNGKKQLQSLKKLGRKFFRKESEQHLFTESADDSRNSRRVKSAVFTHWSYLLLNESYSTRGDNQVVGALRGGRFSKS